MDESSMKPVVSVRLISADYYMTSPIPSLDIGYSMYRGSAVKKVPVIRVFGSTSTGQKACLHIHGVFPYFLVPYDGSAPSDQMGHQIVMALDKAINVLQGQGTSTIHHVYKAALVSGVPIYGYHAKEHQLFKIYFYNPISRKHSYDLLLNGAVLKKNLQPCEAHIPYILQFLIDFNLQGMNFIHVKKALSRRQTSETNLASSAAEPITTCEMEIDCLAEDILNSLEVQGEIQMNPGLAALWEEEIERRKVKNMSLENIHPPASQPRPEAHTTSSHNFYMGNLRKRLRECAIQTGDVSMSFYEVNEQLETSLAIETPESVQHSLLSASTIDFHKPSKEKNRQVSQSEGESELLDILCDLADEHGSVISPSPSSVASKQDVEVREPNNSGSSRMTVTTPILDFVSSCHSDEEEMPFDDDSILGTQRSRFSPCDRGEINEPFSDSDDERETLEMTQVFDDPVHNVPDIDEYTRHPVDPDPVSTSFAQIENDQDESSTGSFTGNYLPNVDGADDGSSDEDKHASSSGTANQPRKYRPLLFRASLKKKVRNTVGFDKRTSFSNDSPTTSPLKRHRSFDSTEQMPQVDNSLQKIDQTQTERSRSHQLPTEAIKSPSRACSSNDFMDALYALSYLSPIEAEQPESPPRPETPIKRAQITLGPLLQDIQNYESGSGRSITVNSGRVILKSLEEEVSSYESETHVKLRFPSLKSNRPKKRLRVSNQYNSDVSEETMGSPAQLKPEATDHTPTEIAGPSSSELTVSADQVVEREISDMASVPNLVDNSQSKAIIDQQNQPENGCPEPKAGTQPNENISIGQLVGSSLVFENLVISEDPKPCPKQLGSQVLDISMSLIASTEPKPNTSIDRVDEKEYPSLEDDNSTRSSSHGPNSWLGSSQPLSAITAGSPNSKGATRSDSSTRFWNDESSLFVGDQPPTMEKEQQVSQVEVEPVTAAQLQVFLPMSVYTNEKDGPCRQHVRTTFQRHTIPCRNGAPFWGDTKDLVLPAKTKDSRRVAVPIGSNLIGYLPEFGSNFHSVDEEILDDNNSPIVITPLAEPPSRKSVLEWLDSQKSCPLVSSSDLPELPKKRVETKKKKDASDRSQLEAPSMNNSFGFRVSFGNCLEAKAVHKNQYVTVMSLELHIQTRHSLRPDPECDPVTAVFYTITNDVPIESSIPDMITGVILVHSDDANTARASNLFSRAGVVNVDFVAVETEAELFQYLSVVVAEWNPDILVGFEIEMLSWGYLLQRSTILCIPFHNLLSRIPQSAPEKAKGIPEDIIEGGYMVEKNSDINVPGRIILNLWRILKVEIALQSYTFENLVFHILHRRVSTYTFEKLTNWWAINQDRWQVIEHYVTRVRGNIELMEQLDVIGRTSELARLFGIQFYEVFTRGSQYRVESMMLRLAKPKNFVAASPSVIQRSRMKAPEWLPLIMEPESRFYTDPVLVLDFQSLYPSMIIAYNYCYSTCLGRTHLIGKNEPFEFGCTQLLIPPATVQKLVKQNLVNISPAGVVFVKPQIRTGILPQMLSEILNTRIMVKQSMKEYEGDNTLRRVFDSRQLGLKLIANVTYGYTSANFSGRMPCVELGDSVVSKGRETLERAIHLIESHHEWKARVVYGDTDSVFVLLPGRSRQEAFVIGEEIAAAVTKTNPQPVKLKFEKVYQPCILQTKKRYVGYKYESIHQKESVYEAKGIETVRRDGCPAVVKLLERSLRLLFESCDVSKVKAYVQRQFSKIIQNRNSLQDFIFAKEFRGRQGYKPGACVPALEITKQQMRIDKRAEPRIGERVPYIVIYGSPGVPLIRLVVPANQLLVDPSLRLNGHYYISRAIIPALQRCFGLLGVDVLSWYQNLPRASSGPSSVVNNDYGNIRKATISQYFGSSLCLLCDEPILIDGLCAGCGSNRQASSFLLASIQRLREKDYAELISLCRHCTGNSRIDQDCVSMDCPVLYRRVKAYQNLQLVSKCCDALSNM